MDEVIVPIIIQVRQALQLCEIKHQCNVVISYLSSNLAPVERTPSKPGFLFHLHRSNLSETKELSFLNAMSPDYLNF